MVEELLQRIKELEERLNRMESHYKEIIRQKDEEISKLKSLTNKNSQNSSFSPSSDKFKRPIKSSRRPSNKKSGGQENHKGSHLEFSPTPDSIEEIKPKYCEHCNHIFDGQESSKIHSRQVKDIPEQALFTTEFRNYSIQCSCCKKVTSGHFPPEAKSKVQYGNRLKSLIVYMSQYQLIPYKRITDFIFDLYGAKISEGTILNSLKECYQNLKIFESEVKDLIKNSPVLNLDETGAYCNKHRSWIHTASTKKLTLLNYSMHRGKKAINSFGILPEYKGVAVHDFYASYRDYECRHSLCNAHLIRDLTFQFEEKDQLWANLLKSFLIKVKMAREKEKGDSFSYYKLNKFSKEYDRIVKKGFRINPVSKNNSAKRGRTSQSDTVNLLLRLKNYKHQVLAFMYNFLIPFDNNQAERDFRMVKVQQKISGTFRSEMGALIFCRIRSFISTVNKNSKNIIEEIYQSFCLKSNYSHIWAE